MHILTIVWGFFLWILANCIFTSICPKWQELGLMLILLNKSFSLLIAELILSLMIYLVIFNLVTEWDHFSLCHLCHRKQFVKLPNYSGVVMCESWVGIFCIKIYIQWIPFLYTLLRIFFSWNFVKLVDILPQLKVLFHLAVIFCRKLSVRRI